MDFIKSLQYRWAKLKPGIDKKAEAFDRFSKKLLEQWKVVEKFKKLLLSVPVAAMAIILAVVNLFELPALVDLGITDGGGEAIEIYREFAVLGPLTLTILSLLMVFASKRTLTPWMVSVFSLLLPIVLLLTNAFAR